MKDIETLGGAKVVDDARSIAVELQESLGDGMKKIEENEQETVILQQRSICATNALKKGMQIKKDDLTMLRPCPADAIPPYEMKNVIGKILKRNINPGEYIKWTDLI